MGKIGFWIRVLGRIASGSHTARAWRPGFTVEYQPYFRVSHHTLIAITPFPHTLVRVGGKLYLKEGHLWRTSMAGRVGIYPVTTGSNKLVCSTHTGLHSGNRICSFLVTQSVIFACHVENLHLNRLNWEDCRRVARLQFWTPAPHCCIIFQTSPPM